MYRVKENVNLDALKAYGFKIGREWPDADRCIDNDSERDDYWLIALDEDGDIDYADEEYDQPIWSVHVQTKFDNRLWIECVPAGTYHIDNVDMEYMFAQLYKMIRDGIIIDFSVEEDA